MTEGPNSTVNCEAKRPPGRPRFKPTPQDRALVAVLIGSGLSIEETRQNVMAPNDKAISESTFRRAFREEIENGRSRFKGLLVRRYVRFLNSADERVALRATEIGLKAHAGWTERTGVELTGRDGGPLQTQDVGAMTKEEKAAAFAKALVMHFKAKGSPPELVTPDDRPMEATVAPDTVST